MTHDTHHFGLEHDYTQHAPHDSNGSHEPSGDGDWIDTVQDDGGGVGD